MNGKITSVAAEHESLWMNWEFWIALGTLALAVATIALAIGTIALVKEAKKTSIRQLRAYIDIEFGGVILNSPQPGYVTAWLRFKNVGATPAYKFKCWHKFSIKPVDEQPFEKTGDFDSEAIVGSGASINSDSNLLITDQTIEAVKQKTHGFYLWGRVEYVDIFKQNRFLTFKSMMNGAVQTVVIDDIRTQGWGLRAVPNGFDAN